MIKSPNKVSNQSTDHFQTTKRNTDTNKAHSALIEELTFDITRLSIEDTFDIANIPEVDKKRSEGAIAIHKKLMSCSKAKSTQDFKIKKVLLSEEIDEQDASCLLELSVNGFSHFDDAVHLPFEIQQDKKFAGNIALALLSLLLEKRKTKKIPLNTFAEKILSNRSNNGFMLLQLVLPSGNPKLISEIIKLMDHKRFNEILKTNLWSRTDDGYMVLNQAIASNNPEVVFQAIELLRRKGFEEILLANISNRTSNGMMVLQHAVSLGNPEVVYQIIKLLQRKGFEEVLRANLLNKTKIGFMLLQFIFNKCNPQVASQVIELLERKKFEEILQKDLSNKENSGLMTLIGAIKRSSELLKRQEYKEIFHKNLANRTNDGFMVLQDALCKGEAGLIFKTLNLLEQAGDEILRENLKNRTKSGFMPLQDTITHCDHRDVLTKIFELYERKGFEEILQENLLNKTKNDVTLMHSTIRAGNPKILAKIISLSEARLPTDKWQSLLVTHTKQGENLLHYAAATNNRTIFKRVISAIRKAYPNNAENIIKKLANQRTAKGNIPKSFSSKIEKILQSYRKPYWEQQSPSLTFSFASTRGRGARVHSMSHHHYAHKPNDASKRKKKVI